jgi:hypothetical protein
LNTISSDRLAAGVQPDSIHVPEPDIAKQIGGRDGVTIA